MLEARGLAPRKSLGQNFLIDHNLLRKLVDAAGVGEGDIVLEVGPGTGALTIELLARGCRVVACELDEGLADLLEDTLVAASGGRLRLVRGDCLASKHAINPELLATLGDGPFTLVANLPYAAATPLLMTLLLDHPRCLSMHVTIQREVADRLRAGPGSKDYAEISVVAQALAEIRWIAPAPPECFWPRPKVHSAMLSLVRRAEPLTDSPRALQELCRRLFTKRRKQLGAILGRGVDWPEGVTPEQRPEALTVSQLADLVKRAPAPADGVGPGA